MPMLLTLLNKDQSVQECDATKLNSAHKACIKKIKNNQSTKYESEEIQYTCHR